MTKRAPARTQVFVRDDGQSARSYRQSQVRLLVKRRLQEEVRTSPPARAIFSGSLRPRFFSIWHRQARKHPSERLACHNRHPLSPQRLCDRRLGCSPSVAKHGKSSDIPKSCITTYQRRIRAPRNFVRPARPRSHGCSGAMMRSRLPSTKNTT